MQALKDVIGNKEYANLPESIRQYYTEKEWLWLSDSRKASLMQDELEPDFV